MYSGNIFSDVVERIKKQLCKISAGFCVPKKHPNWFIFDWVINNIQSVHMPSVHKYNGNFFNSYYGMKSE